MKSNLDDSMVTQNKPKKQPCPERTCTFCGHTGPDVGPCEFPTLDRKHLAYKDVCDDIDACNARVEAMRALCGKEVEEHIKYMQSDEYKKMIEEASREED